MVLVCEKGHNGRSAAKMPIPRRCNQGRNSLELPLIRASTLTRAVHAQFSVYNLNAQCWPIPSSPCADNVCYWGVYERKGSLEMQMMAKEIRHEKLKGKINRSSVKNSASLCHRGAKIV
jgi:hypothetical protein